MKWRIQTSQLNPDNTITLPHDAVIIEYYTVSHFSYIRYAEPIE